MNEQLPPVDSDLHVQLARRSAGRLPDGLASDVFTALDSAPVRRPIWRVPRLAVAGMGVAVVVVMVAAIALSAVHTAPAASPISPAGYPAERALTAAELASLMAGPALPVNTALVASVAIEVHNDVCPMNRYPTVGVIAGIGSQVCVVGDATLAAQTSNTTMSGTYAFRYLAPGVLGLLGQITPASARLAFKVTDEWPLPSAIFLVQGWLGADKLAESCFLWPASDDVLGPAGNNCPFEDWLGDEATAPGISNDYVSHQGSPSPSYDLLSLRGNARHVGAGGMRTIDSIDSQTPVRGTFVVSGANGPCPGAAPQENRGCTTWLVLAKLADITLPAPNSSSTAATPTPTTVPPATPILESPGSLAPGPGGLVGPGNRALTVAELTSLVSADPAGLVGSAAIVEGPVPLGTCQKLESSILCPDLQSSMTADGTFAIRVGIGRQLSLIGQGLIEVRPDGIVWTLPQVIAAKSSGLFVVDAWLDWEDGCDAPSDPPYGTGGCGSSLLTAEKLDWMHMASLLPPNAVVTWVQSDGYRQFGSHALSSGAIHGVYLVGVVPGATPTIIARLEPAVLP